MARVMCLRAAGAGVVMALLTGALSFAQPPAGGAPPPPSSSGLVKKGKAPVSNEVLAVTLPKAQEATLSNGLRLLVLEDHRLPQIAFQVIIPGAGGYYDPVEMTGLSSYTAQMMREGTRSRTSQQISQELETMAASVTVASGISNLTAALSGSALTENFDRLLALSADVLLNPSFAAEEWDRLKTRSRAQLVQQRTQPFFLGNERLSKVLNGDHPAGRVAPTPASLDAITREAMVEFHRTRFVPEHGAIAFAGDITLAEARTKAEAVFGVWKKTGTAAPVVSDPAAPAAPKVYLVARPSSVQTSLLVGAMSMKRTDPDYVALTVANRVLGGTMGRLFRHLREEKGYTYGVGSGFSALRHIGSWVASTDVRTDVTDAALTDLLADVAAMRSTPIPADELQDAKRAITAGFALSLESPQQLLGYYVQSWTYGLPADYWDTYPARIAAVTAAEAQAAAAKYWDPAKLQIVAVGDASKIATGLEKMGTVEIYDAEGRKKN